MKQTKFVFAAAALFVLALGGCKKDEAPTNPPTGGGGTASSVPTISNFGGATPTNVLVAVRTSTTLTVAGVTVTNDATIGTAVFGAPGQDKGDVKAVIGGTDYPFTKSVANGATTYTYAPTLTNPTGLPLNAGATTVTFNATGQPLSPAAVTVPGQLKLTAPAANTTVPRNANLTVTWTITNPGVRSAVFITDYSGHYKFYENLTGTSFTIPTADLQALTAGGAIVYAISYNYVLSNSNAAVLIGEAVALNTITLQ